MVDLVLKSHETPEKYERFSVRKRDATIVTITSDVVEMVMCLNKNKVLAMKIIRRIYPFDLVDSRDVCYAIWDKYLDGE